WTPWSLTGTGKGRLICPVASWWSVAPTSSPACPTDENCLVWWEWSAGRDAGARARLPQPEPVGCDTRVPHPRRPVYAPHGVCATSQPLAAAAGAHVLRTGGNAVDAAVAAAVTLTVVQPGSNDIGGDLFAIVWDGQRLHGLNASGRAPAALTRQAVLETGAAPAATEAHGGAQAHQAGHGAMPAVGWASVTVPGAPAGWRDLHERFGRL